MNMYNILEHKKEIAENIQKAFGDTPEDIEKAKWQIGEIRTDSRGIAHECYEYTAEGKPRLRRVKKNKSGVQPKSDSKQSNNKTISFDANHPIHLQKRGVFAMKDYLTTFNSKYKDLTKVEVTRTPKGNWDVRYDGHRLGIISGDEIPEDTAKKMGWLKEDSDGNEKSIDEQIKELEDVISARSKAIARTKNVNLSKSLVKKQNEDKEKLNNLKEKKNKFTENSFKNNFDSIISNISSIVDKVFVEKPVGRDASTVDKTYKTSDWKKGVHTVGNGFYGKDELLQLDIKGAGNIETIQLRKPISKGIGSSYNNKPIGHVIVEVFVNNDWLNFDMTKESGRKDFVELLNKNIKK